MQETEIELFWLAKHIIENSRKTRRVRDGFG